jgi:hypothetical protein
MDRVVAHPDFLIENHGSLFLVRGQNTYATDWLIEHTDDSSQWLGAALAVEHRYIHDLVAHLQSDGFIVA